MGKSRWQAGSGISFIRALKITNTGKVRIGEKSPTALQYSNSALSVDSTILAKGIYVLDNVQAVWADYIFEKNYKLMPLDEVEKFINTNKHLPNVPSADEVAEKGQGLGKLQIKQMEKIEEAFLYIIELKKEVDALKVENQKLKTAIKN